MYFKITKRQKTDSSSNLFFISEKQIKKNCRKQKVSQSFLRIERLLLHITSKRDLLTRWQRRSVHTKIFLHKQKWNTGVSDAINRYSHEASSDG